GAYEDHDPYAALRSHHPDDVIGNSIFVFDLDRLGGGSPFRWPPPKSQVGPGRVEEAKSK
ncbi:MAG TPA: hypothetical protein VHS97_17155, partial [Isosphaeraceae bacterium]|nr:hypothetical protein [Isosphaeraceae bacterium]